MPAARGENLIALRLDDGDDLLPSLKSLLGNDSTAVIVSAIGMLRDFELGWLGPEGYIRRTFREPFELLSVSGTVNRKPDGSAFIHPHASLSGADYSVVGGHLFGGRVHNTLEMVLMVPQDLIFRREILKEGEPPRFCPERK